MEHTFTTPQIHFATMNLKSFTQSPHSHFLMVYSRTKYLLKMARNESHLFWIELNWCGKNAPIFLLSRGTFPLPCLCLPNIIQVLQNYSLIFHTHKTDRYEAFHTVSFHKLSHLNSLVLVMQKGQFNFWLHDACNLYPKLEILLLHATWHWRCIITSSSKLRLVQPLISNLRLLHGALWRLRNKLFSAVIVFSILYGTEIDNKSPAITLGSNLWTLIKCWFVSRASQGTRQEWMGIHLWLKIRFLSILDDPWDDVQAKICRIFICRQVKANWGEIHEGKWWWSSKNCSALFAQE